MTRERIIKFAEELAGLDDGSQRLFLETFLTSLSEKKRLQWFQWNCHIVYPKIKWLKIDRWMEGQFRRDMRRQPRMVASMCVNYFRVNPKMYPFLVKMARRVKHRILTRMRRHPGDNDEAD